MRTTALVLAVLAGLLLLNVVVPQEATTPAEVYAELASRNALSHFFLETLELGRLSRSPIFLSALALFFLNLACVLSDRARTTWLRLSAHPPTVAQLGTLAEGPQAVSFPLPEGMEPARATAVLEALGYRAVRPGPGCVWGVKNRLALLGFPLFHLSFFVLCAGGVAIYYTRHAVATVATEGQAFSSIEGQVSRHSPLGEPRPERIRLIRVDPKLEGGRPIQLGAVLQLEEPGAGPPQTAWINRPAEWGGLSVLVERAGLAPVFRLQDGRGFIVQRFSVVAMFNSEGRPSGVRLDQDEIDVAVQPVEVGPDFPMREQLATFAVKVRVERKRELLFDGQLRPGQVVRVGEHFLALEEVRYWVFLRLIQERGGALLIAGFLLAVLGITFRMVWHRREVGVVFDERGMTLCGRTEYFPLRFREELKTIGELLLSRGAKEPGAAA
ncbi:MAG: cytochrome c biogenesis protein ResB [Myxococcales bacterium]|nr:cytochrome c biogenesis protein ResB [Myxococcales bacterium]